MKVVRKILKVLLCICACLLMSIPFALIMDVNIHILYGSHLHNTFFEIISIIFGIQIILSIVGAFLLYVKHIESEDDNRGCLPMILGFIDGVCLYKLSDFGDGWRSGGRYAFSKFDHADWNEAVFYACMAYCWLWVMVCTVAFVLGRFAND